MLAVHARYRGSAPRRADLVQRSAAALSSLDGVDGFEVIGVEDIASTMAEPSTVCDITMALLADGEWAVGIGIARSGDEALSAARRALPRNTRAGIVRADVVSAPPATAEDIAACFALLGQVLNKRTYEGREATALVRSGLSQNEAAEQLGISKQAISQRLQAAGWAAESAGWRLAVNLLSTANQISADQG
ncbi:MarR family transcriptional regulator [Corynebacterium propinquum]